MPESPIRKSGWIRPLESLEPYDSNWYSGAERGLMEYIHDEEGGCWRPTGYAEHYVMRDLLGAVVIGEITANDGILVPPQPARWCYRHGLVGGTTSCITAAAPIPRIFNLTKPFLQPTRQTPISRKLTASDPATRTGCSEPARFGMYYYIEQLDQIPDVLALATSAEYGLDLDRLRPRPITRNIPAGSAGPAGSCSWTAAPGPVRFSVPPPSPKLLDERSGRRPDRTGNAPASFSTSYGPPRP